MPTQKPNVTQKLDALLGIGPSEDADSELMQQPAKVVSTGNPEKDFAYDHDIVRQALHHLLERGIAVVDDIDKLARDSQEPKMFDAASTAKKEAREIAMALLDIHGTQKTKSGKPSTNVKGDMKIVNNLAFHGTTSELLKQMKLTQTEEVIEVAQTTELVETEE